MAELIPSNHYPSRKPQYEDRPILFVSSTSCLDEHTGEIFDRKCLPAWIRGWASGDSRKSCPVIVCNDSVSILKELADNVLHPRFTWRATPLRKVKRSAAKPPTSKPAVSVKLHVHYCGFKRTSGHRDGRYFHFIDCVNLTGSTSNNLYPEMCETESLETFGRRYRELCRDNQLKMGGTRGGFGSAMLRDPRFIGDSSRRIPTFINEAAREHLPGNHYELRTETEKFTSGIYLDITNAHHVAAHRTEFPDPSGIRARGYYRSPPTDVAGREPWAADNSRVFQTLSRTHGLVLLRVGFNGMAKNSIIHPAANQIQSTKRSKLIWVYTNEIEFLKRSGFTVYGIEAAFTAGRTSSALNNFAQFAMESLDKASKEDRPWMKSLFISTYGMLAKRPSKYQSVSNLGDGVSFDWPTPNGFLEGRLKTGHTDHSPVTTNVIALGMIQAETRRNVIETAGWLQSLGIRVLALYADSIIVAGDSQLPLLPPEWRVKQNLTNLRFLDSVSWIADEDLRLPGRGGSSFDRQAHQSASKDLNRGHPDRFFSLAPAWKGKDKSFAQRTLY